MTHEIDRAIVSPAQKADIADLEIINASGFDCVFRSAGANFPALALDDQLYISGPGATKNNCGAWRVLGVPTPILVNVRRIDKMHGVPSNSDAPVSVRLGYNGNLMLREGVVLTETQTSIASEDIEVLALRTRYPAGTSNGSPE